MISTLSMNISGWPRSCSGFVQQSSSDKVKVGMNYSHTKSLNTNLPYRLTSEYKYSSSKMQSQQGSSRIMVTRADGPYLSIDEDIDTDPFLLWLGKEFLRDFKSALLFLWEQSGQLKYIEWPSFQSTLWVICLCRPYGAALESSSCLWLFLRQKRELQMQEISI